MSIIGILNSEYLYFIFENILFINYTFSIVFSEMKNIPLWDLKLHFIVYLDWEMLK